MAEQTFQVGTDFTEVQIPSGNFTIYLNQNSKFFLVSRSPDGENALMCNKYYDVIGPATIYIKGDNPQSSVIISDFFRQQGGGGGGASSGQAPILVENGVIKLLVTNEFLVNEANQLALALNNNETIQQIISQLNSLKGSLEYIGQIQSSNQQVAETPNLLTEFVKTQQSREPQAGDLITTNDTPPYAWIYASNKGTGGEITSYEWKPMGTTGLSVASNTTLGIVKGTASGAGKVSVGADGTMTVNNAVLTSGAQTIGGTKTFSNAVTFNSNILLTERLNFRGNLSIAPSTNEVFTIHLANGAIGTNCYANLDFENKGKIINLVNPTNPHDASNKAYVDSQIASQANALILGAEAPTTDNVPQGKLALYIQPQS